MKRINSSMIQAKNPSTGNFENISFLTHGIDSELSDTSENSVQNKVITQALNDTNDEIEKTNNVLPDLVDNGAKNCVDISRLTNLAPTYISYTIDGDGLLYVSHTARSGSGGDTMISSVYLKPGTYVLSGCPSGGGGSTYQLDLYDSSGTTVIVIDNGSTAGVEFTITTADSYMFRIRCNASATFSNVLFKPMICTKSAWDVSHRFVSPYAGGLLGGVNNRGKNFYYFDDILGNGIGVNCSYTELSPGVYQCSCSATGGSARFIQFSFRIEYPGRFILSGCPSGGSDTGYQLDIRSVSVSGIIAKDYGNGSDIFYLNAGNYLMTIRFDGSQESYSNIVFKPMLCTPEDWALSHDFVPGVATSIYTTTLNRRFQKNNTNATTYTFSALRDLENSGIYHYGILVGGGGSNVSGSIWLVFVGAGTEGVIITKIGGDDSKTLTGTVDRATSALTITSNTTIYGGLRLIWLE